jgi:DMSO reductase family type II enzyme heme b subunit
VASLMVPLASRPLGELLYPWAPAWQEAPLVVVPLAPVPLEGQTSAYVRDVWAHRPYGQTPEVELRALHDGQRLALQLSWLAPQRRDLLDDDDVFLDAACVMFAMREDTPISMGSPQRPVRGWLWRPDWPQPREVRATGPGTSQRGPGDGLEARASWQEGRWTVVMAGPLPQERLLAVAIWRGADMERAGLKAYSPRWLPLELRREEGQA